MKKITDSITVALSASPLVFSMLIGLICMVFMLNGCTVVSANRVFPKLAWSWSADAKEQRREDAMTKANAEAYRARMATNSIPKLNQ